MSSALTPYEVESFCDHIARLGCLFSGEVHVSVDADGLERGCPELRALAHCVKRLRGRGVVVRVHTARLRKSALQSVKVDRLALAR